MKGGQPGTGNIDKDPHFVHGPTREWTADGIYDPDHYTITFTNTGTVWVEDEHVGKLINPDTTQPLQLYIVANTIHTITVMADWKTIDQQASWVLQDSTYRIFDYHLKDFSPCIDAGDNNAPDLPDTDVDGDPRRYDMPLVPDTGSGQAPIVDMGYDEVV